MRFRLNMIRGLMYIRKKDYDQARESFAAAMKTNPRSPEPHFMLGIMFLGSFKKKAIQSLKRALALKPDQIRFGKASILSANGNARGRV